MVAYLARQGWRNVPGKGWTCGLPHRTPDPGYAEAGRGVIRCGVAPAGPMPPQPWELGHPGPADRTYLDGDGLRAILSPGGPVTSPEQAEALGLTVDARRMRGYPGLLTVDQRADLLDRAVREAARHGWRMDARDRTSARLSRPVFWLPWWAHVLLTAGSCLAWAVVWAAMRNPRARRTALHLDVDASGHVHRLVVGQSAG
jgi:hypothetical protein